MHTLEDIARPHEIGATVNNLPVMDLEYFCIDPRPQVYEVNFHLPDGLAPGLHPMEVSIGRRKLAPVTLNVVAAV